MYLIHRNKHREAAKKRTQRNRSQIKEQENYHARLKQKGGKQNTRYKVQNNDYKDAQDMEKRHGNNEKEPVRNKE